MALPTGLGSGGVEALTARTSNTDPFDSLNDKLTMLTSAIDKLNDAVIDLVDVEEDSLSAESGGTTGGVTRSSFFRKKPRRRRSMHYHRDRDIDWITRTANRLNPNRDHLKRAEFTTDMMRGDFGIYGDLVRGIGRVPGAVLSGMSGMLRGLGTPAGAGIAGAVGIGALAYVFREEISDLGNRITNAFRESRDRENQRQSATPEENRDRTRQNNNRGNPGRTGVRPIEGLENPTSYGGVKDYGQDAEPADEPSYISPYYSSRDLDPRDLETKTFGPAAALVMPGATPGVAGSGAVVGGAIQQQTQAANAAAERATQSAIESFGQTIMDGLRNVLGIRSAGSVSEQQQLLWEIARMRQAGQLNAPGSVPGAVSNAPSIPAPEAAPVPAAPVSVPSVTTPEAAPEIRPFTANPPAPQAPADVPLPQAPTVVRADVPTTPMIRPMTGDEAAMDAYAQYEARRARAAAAQPALPDVRDRPSPPPSDVPVPDAIPHAPAIPHATPQVVPQQAIIPQPPPPPPTVQPPALLPVAPPAPVVRRPMPPAPTMPYRPPSYDRPQATGGANMGRGMGFEPIPPAPPSPTTRTPSYPQRLF